MTNLEQFRSTADEKSLGIIFNMLSTLYANPERSVMREYIANALDAHQLAGTERPVEVTLPTSASPNLVIRDFGSGLSLEDLKHVFFGFARSTKTDSDEQIGALGIGAKSAFALSKAWTVTNIHEGKKYVVASVNDASGPMQSVIVNGDATDEPSGITVSVPIERAHMSHSWDDTARELLRWFPKDSVSVHGLNDVSHWTDTSTVYGPLVLDNDDSRPYYHRVDFRVAMCGVAYVVDSETTDRIHQSVLGGVDKLLAQVEGADRFAKAKSLGQVTHRQAASKDNDDERIARQVIAHREAIKSLAGTVLRNVILMDSGAIDFMPSRESVQGNPRTVDAITAAINIVLHKFANEMVAYRTLVPSERIAKTYDLGRHLASRNGVTLLDALGVHNVETPVSRRKDKYTLHALVNHLNTTAGAVLVHDMGGIASLYKRGIMERLTGQNIYTMEGDPNLPGFGDLSVLFHSTDERLPAALTREEYKAIATKVAPKSEDSYGRSSDATTYAVYTMSHDAMTWEAQNDLAGMTFDEIVDEYAGSDVPIYLTAGAYSYSRHGSEKGLNAVVIDRGRRQSETFAKALGIEVKDSDALYEDADKSSVERMTALLGQYSPTDLTDMSNSMFFSKRTLMALKSVLNSTHGSLVASDHRARKIVNSANAGAKLLKHDERLSTCLSELAQEDKIPASLSAIKNVYRENPWPLLDSLNTVSNPSSDAIHHAAVYLAAVG